MAELTIYPVPRTTCSYREGEQKRDIAINHKGSFVVGKGEAESIFHSDKMRIQAALNKITLAEMGAITKTFNSTIIDCPQCSACYAARINIADFDLSASQQRKIRLNKDIAFDISPLHIDQEVTNLVNSYFARRFPEDQLRHKTVQGANMELGGSYHMGIARHASGKLMGVSFIDAMPSGIAATLTAYDIDESKKRSIGTMMDLWLFTYAQQHNIAHVYLGPWAKDSRIKHKSQYNGFEVLMQDGETSRWAPISTLSQNSRPKSNREIVEELGISSEYITELGLHR